VPDPKPTDGHQPSKSISPEEGGHRVTSPSAADAKKGEAAPEPPEYGETIDGLDAEPGTAGKGPRASD
jgi:hypothetical protein